MKAMILAAGLGTRMRPLTLNTPKPLLKINQHTLIEEHIFKLRNAGFTEIIINTWHLAEQIHNYLGDGQNYGLQVHYSDEQNEPEPLETAGGIKKALHYFNNEVFLVINGDIYSDFPLQNHFELNHYLAHLVLVNNPEHHLEGDFAIQSGLLKNSGQPKYTFSGIGYYHPDFFKQVKIEPTPLAPLLRQFADQNAITAEHYSGKWLDIGTVERLEQLRMQLSG